jgi:2-polyprenyl-6-hydroxyphenyl methylase/3-demethylubiquinone-9 3-methyltransferase
MQNTEQTELAKFTAIASTWWDRDGDFKALHDINPLRLDFINQYAPLAGKKVLDIGCGGGILSEAMAALGATVTGIDMADAALDVAKLHLLESGQQVDYQLSTAEAYASEHAGQFDIVTCLELLEHVPNPAPVIEACAQLVKPEGAVFLSTINRNPKAYVHAIIGAEYILKLLPKGMHDYAKFIKPSEMARWARASNLHLQQLKGLGYNLFDKQYSLNDDVSVNYLTYFRKTPDE